MSQEDLATELGYKSRSSIAKIEAGVNDLTQSKIIAFAEALHTTPDYLMEWTDDAINYDDPSIIAEIPTSLLKEYNVETAYKIHQAMLYDMGEEHKGVSNLPKYDIRPITTKKIPLLGEIACGEPIFANEEHEYFVEASTDIRADFALQAKGDSMINARINDGDIVFIRQQPDVNNGEIAAVIIDDEVTLKRVYKQDKGVMLVAENPKYNPIIYTENDAVTINILGKAVAFQSELEN